MRTTTSTLLVLAAAALLASGCDETTAPCGGAGNICTVMGTGTAGLGKDGRPALEVNLYLPQDLAFGPDGRMYVLDWNNHRVRTVDGDGLVRTVIGTGSLGDAPDGPALGASLNHPTHVTFSPNGKLIMSAWHNSKMVEVDLASGEMMTFCGTGARAFGGDGGPASEALLDLPVASAFDSLGRIYIMDQANQRVRRIGDDGVIETVVGPAADYLPDGYTQVCSEGDLGQLVCKNCKDAEASDPECEDQPLGRPQGFAGDGGPATEAFLFLPYSQSAPPAGRIEMGPNDTLYIADTGNHRIRRVTADGNIATVAGSGPDTFDPAYQGGYAGDGGPANQARLRFPVDIAVADDGTLYIADTQNSCIRRVTTDGTIDTYAGRCGENGYDGDGGDPTRARLNRPYGVALDADGNLYIADTHNHRLRVVYK